MPIYPYSFQLPPLNVQDIPNDGVAGQFLGINGSGALDWLPVSAGGGDMLKSENLSGLADYPTARTNLGLGTGDSPTFKNLTISTGSIATSAPVTISQTWNAGSNAMTAFKVVATDTASGTASNFLSLDLSTNNVLGEKWRFRFEKSGTLYSTGNIQLGIGLAASASLLMGNGFYAVGGGNGLFMGSGVGGYILAHGATQLWRGSADHILEQRNSTAAQTFNVYGTYTASPLAYSRLAIACDTSGNATLTTQSTGTAGTVSIGNSNKIIIGAPNNVVLAFNATDATSTGFRTGGSNTLELVRSDAGAYANLTVNNLTLQGALIASNFPLSSNSNIAGTNVEAASFIVSTTSNGTTAAGFGTRLLYKTETDTNALQDSGAISSVWSNAVNATRTSDMLFYNVLNGTLTERMRILGTTGNVGIGTTAPSSKLHVVGNSSPGIAVENTIATGYSELLFKNTVATGSSIFLNGSAQTGFGGANSLNLYTSNGPLAFHTATVTNALSIAQNGTSTHAGNLIFAPDNSYDIGANGANRPRNIFTSAAITIGSGFALNFDTRVALFPAGSGILRVSDTSFAAGFRLNGATADYCKVQKFDGTGFGAIQGKLTTDTAYTGTTVVPTGFITLYDSTGTAYKVPCVAA
jgi:hypothetical protein